MSSKKGQSSGSKESECTAAAAQGCGLAPFTRAKLGAVPGSRSLEPLGSIGALPPLSSPFPELKSPNSAFPKRNSRTMTVTKPKEGEEQRKQAYLFNPILFFSFSEFET